MNQPDRGGGITSYEVLFIIVFVVLIIAVSITHVRVRDLQRRVAEIEAKK